jgi:DUF1365 family protein
VIGFRDDDHGCGDGTPLRAWIDAGLHRAGIDAAGPVRLLCYPRVFGYAFNPLSVYFCYRRQGDVAAVLYEVNNTFGERHSYLIAAPPLRSGEALRQSCDKVFYVSPFLPMQARYHFRITPPEDKVSVTISERDAQGPLLYAAFTGRRVAISDAAMLRLLIRYPLMTLKVIAGVYWEALRLWQKGVPTVARPAAPPTPITIVASKPSP